MNKYKIWPEKVFDIHPDGHHYRLRKMFTSRKWTKLISPYTKINHDLLKEFYANAVTDASPTTMADTFSFTTFVRGKIIRFDRDAINDFLGNPLTLPESEEPTVPTLCPYGEKNRQGNWNFRKIEKDILLKDRRFIKNAAGKLQKALYADMNANASVVFKFLVHNVVPKSHTSDTTMKIVPLIWSIVKGMEVDIARIISNEMKSVTLNCATSGKASLTFPGLIMGLLRANGIKIPTPADEEILHPIDDTFVSSLVKREERTANYQGSSDDEKIAGAGSFDLSSFQSFMDEQQRHNQYVRDQNTYIMHQNEATFRSNMGIHQTLYNAHMHPGDPAYPVMTPEMYQTYVGWPEDRPEPYVEAADDDAVAVDADYDMEDGEDDQ